jgi:hypothetical protein
MSSIKYYKIEFVERTLKLVEAMFENIKKEQDLEVTFLMNCLVGLIVTVAENKQSEHFFSGNIDAGFVEKIPKTVWYLHKGKNSDCGNLQEADSTKPFFISEISDFAVKSKGDLITDVKYTKNQFLKKLRNAIAHQNVKSRNEDGKWVGVRMWNETKSNLVDFEIEFTIAELKNFAIYIANIYIEANKTTQ